MITLTRMLLINWYGFRHQVIAFQGLNFLTGIVGSGKSTLLDAMQLVLYGDKRGRYFNLAANKHANRTLTEYVFHHDGKRPLREGKFSSYVVMEWEDRSKQRFFLTGFAADCVGTMEKQDFDGKFFIADGKIPNHEMIYVKNRQKHVCSIRELQEDYRTQNTTIQFFDSGKNYLTKMLAEFRLQGSDQFMELMKKAVPFEPMIGIQEFIARFIAEGEANETEQAVATMRENIQHYKDLERQHQLFTERHAMLQSISDLHHVKLRDAKSEKTKLDAMKHYLEWKRMEQDVQKHAKEAEEATRAKQTCEQTQQTLEQEKKQVQDQLLLLQDVERTEAHIEHLTAKKQQQQKDWKQVTDYADHLTKHITQWRTILENAYPMDWSHSFKQAFHVDPKSLTEAQLLEMQQWMQNEKEKLSEEDFDVRKQIDMLQSNLTRVDQTIKQLEQNIKPYPKSVEQFVRAMQTDFEHQFQQSLTVSFLCDQLEINDPVWQPIIEQWLGRRRFALLVDESHYPYAMRFLKHYPGHKADVFLIDTEKVPTPNIRPNSLAEELRSSHAKALAYAKHLLRAVIKCTEIQDLRNHAIAVMPDGLCYQDFATTHRSLDQLSLFIGQDVIQLQLKQAREQKQVLQEKQDHFTARQRFTKRHAELHHLSLELYQLGDETFDDRMQTLMVSLKAIQRELDELQSEEWKMKKQHKEAIEAMIGSLEKQIMECAKLIGGYDTAFLLARKLEIEKNNEVIEKETEYASLYAFDVLEDVEKNHRSFSSKKIEEALERVQHQLGSIQNELRRTRADYSHRYQAGLDPDQTASNEWDALLEQANEDAAIHDYETQIAHAQKQAERQFQEDFLYQIRHRITEVIHQIQRINWQLDKFHFGESKYRFQYGPNPQYESFYQLLINDLWKQDEELDLFSQAFTEKHGQARDELFDAICLESDPQKVLQNIQLYSNYTTYLTFDMIETKGGQEIKLSKSVGKNSGGEGQTPFYVIILAAFAHLYRIFDGNRNQTPRLVIFDEGFSKMDPTRIQECLRLCKDMGFQLIIAAPPDKIGPTYLLMDQNLLFTKKPDNGQMAITMITKQEAKALARDYQENEIKEEQWV